MRKQTTFIFYLLGVYVVLQFAWWGYHLIELTREQLAHPEEVNKRILMVLGEGLVFFVLLLLGLWKIRSSIRKEIAVSKQQANFLLSVTHELKTPLAGMRLLLQTAKRPQLDPEKKAELVSKAIDENERLSALVENLLQTIRIDQRGISLHMESFSIRPFCERIVSQMNNAEAIRIQGDDMLITADTFLMERIITNLLENAQKYGASEQGIEVVINSQLRELHIVDFGVGIAKDQGAAIFKKFYRPGDEETREKQGTGLGLYISREFAKLQGFELSYQANEPTGSIFVLKL